MTTERYKNFEVTTVPMEGSNLIEASAGTGKTYSIGILVLRLVLEKQISVKEILMVTFTKAAVAELKERIRKFMRQAYQVSFGFPVDNDDIINLVLEAGEKSDPESVNKLLRDAVLLLDEISVLTIHSFCQQILNEYAFETDQLFGAEMVPDTSPIVERELNKFWRRQITTLHPELLQLIWQEDMRARMQNVLEQHMSGKKYLGYEEGYNYHVGAAKQEEWQQAYQQLATQLTDITTQLHDYICRHTTDLTNSCNKNTHAKKAFAEVIAVPEAFVAAVRAKKNSSKPPGYLTELFPEVLEYIDQQEAVEEEIRKLVAGIHHRLNCFAISVVASGVNGYMTRNNILGYDDLIINLNNALVKRDNPELVAKLQEKYKAVFIDEFQDTDRLQYEIFDRAFGRHTTLFYIGDPKQSIYAWRKADIYTYFSARNNVQHLYNMNYNRRSSEPMIRAMNQFFMPSPDFDTFCFKDEKDSIEYINVDSPENNNKGLLYKAAQPDIPITIYEGGNKSEIAAAVAAQIGHLLMDPGYHIAADGQSRAITPADIGILVRTGKEGAEVKQKLAKLGIPAVSIDEIKILGSMEALEIYYLLEAMETPDRSTINRALLSALTGFSVDDILHLDDELVVVCFGKYREQADRNGVYTALMAFLADFGVRNNLMKDNNGERILTNLLQVIEIVHQVQSRRNLSMRDLISWLKRGIDGMFVEGDEYTQRMESDEEAVKIVTIHKSKGLAYNIVFAPYLDFSQKDNHEFVSFRDPVTGDYISTEEERQTEEQRRAYHQQQEQENRRLIYVAITRAVYKCYIFRNTYYKESSLTAFTQELSSFGRDTTLIEFATSLPEKPEHHYRKYKAQEAPVAAKREVFFHLKEEYWRKLSYTMLAAKAEQKRIPRGDTAADAYDEFIFNTLRRGAKTGNLLHFIFENISFSDNNKWEHWIKAAIEKFLPGQEETYLPMLLQLVQHVVKAPLHAGSQRFQLSSVSRDKRMAEFEFDFPVPVFQLNELNELSEQGQAVSIKRFAELGGQELEGIMNGKIDLFFEHDGRYYVLDWKSNYLGDRPEDYQRASLEAEMNHNNYHLQYLIYTVAVKKYLETRLPEFDYERHFGGVFYLFIRGVRHHGESGIYYTKPALEKIERLERIIAG
ncbi:DNA helicase/exodeoxyribonuclease V, beta subunit [Chitinophaga jiangningensis]|uniref:RecBCD enzyme subunit RecB n=1 Tax=Chitinophaga jiangningensis TaxID=1419482 RepID=A0A1M7K971_9BACT|nr:exodeoxyribonuclease V subunit beta [Chitinophaga jiangningensis]SHM61842.1 DNA helicase/exodeoxyribonuclease V, beta subunit [Chitinophaga jiangningensis]